VSAKRWLAVGAVAVGVLAPPLRKRLGLSQPVASALAWQSPVALCAAMPRNRLRDAGVYALQMWAYFAHYDMPDDDPDALMRRLHVTYPIRVDRAIGLGEVPSVRLQRALGREGEIAALDTALSLVHWAWFLVPHGTVSYVLWRRPERFPRAAAQVAAVFDLGLLGYWGVPTAPPWWAGETGRLPPVRRVMTEAGQKVWKSLWAPLYDGLQRNPFAAMPSLHFATSVMCAHVLSDMGRGHAAAAWSYTAALGFGLVYLGEHYVVDLLVGLALAEGVRLGTPAAVPLARMVSEAVGRLDPGR